MIILILSFVSIAAAACGQQREAKNAAEGEVKAINLLALAVDAEMHDANTPETKFGTVQKAANSGTLSTKSATNCQKYKFGALEKKGDGEITFEMEIDYAPDPSCGDGEKVGYLCTVGKPQAIAAKENPAQPLKGSIACKQVW